MSLYRLQCQAAKGVAPVLKLLKEGVSVGLGTDGPASGNTLDLFTQMRLCAGFQKNNSHDRSAMPAKDIVSMATRQEQGSGTGRKNRFY